MTTAPRATADPVRRRWSSFAPLRHRNYALVFAGGAISNLGTWMETVAVGDLVANRTGEAGWTAFVAAAGFLPMGLLGPVGGAIADRVDRRRFLLLTTSLQLLCAAALAVLAATDHISPPIVAAVVFVAGCIQGVAFPAYMAMVPDLVPADEVLSATSLNQAQWNLGRVLGPALAGVAIGLGSYTAAFAINAISFAAMLVAWRALRLPHREPEVDDDGLWTRIVTGARAAWAEPGVRSAIVLISVVALVASPFISLIPAMARVKFDGSASLTSWFVTAQGIGAVLGALVLTPVAERIGRHRLLLGSVGLLALALAAYGAAPTPLLAGIGLGFVGLSYLWLFSSLGTVAQLRAPTALRARVLACYFLALGVLYPVGSMIQGPIADRIGLSATTIGSGVVLVVAVALIAMIRPARITALGEPAT